MTEHVSISRESPPHRSMDYEALFKEGIGWIERYSGAVWTDYNLHDPGITLLEYLCFGITDVGYRCNFPVTDLLYALENKHLRPVDNAFYEPLKILPCAPLTANDYRRLIMDRLIGTVNNVWVEPATDQRKVFEGVYDIRIQRNEESEAARNPGAIEEAVRRLFCEHRNLCEDIGSVTVLEREFLIVEAGIHLETDASAEEVLAGLLHALEHHLMPKPRFYSFEELKAEDMDLGDILDGPEPLHGFIKTAELLPPAYVLYASQLRDTMSAVPGVRRIEEFSIKLNSIPQFEEEIRARDNTYLTLHQDMQDMGKKRIRLYRNGLPVVPDEVIVRQILNAFTAREYQGFRQRLDLKSPPPKPEKDLADIGAYYSLQRLFPAVYGIGAYGLPREADFLRQAEARQLKGFIALFEIMLASYLKQLTQLRRLFSIEKENPDTQAAPTYFAQFPYDIPDIQALLAIDGVDYQDFETQISGVETLLKADGRAAYQEFVNQRLAEFTTLSDQSAERRNDFLDHLLARFGETVNEELLGQLYPDAKDTAALKRHLIGLKSRILREYDTLSRERGKGFNYLNSNLATEKQANLEAPWRSAEVSGLKKALCYRLNLEHFEDRRLTDFSHFDLLKKEEAEKAAYKTVLPVKAILRSGRSFENYEIKQKKGRYGGWEVYFRENAASAAYVLDAASREEATEKLNQFLQKIEAFDKSCSGFFIVEHLLLRPQATKGFKLTLEIDLTSASLPAEITELPLSGAFSFEHPETGKTRQELEDVVREILVTGSKRANYEIAAGGKILLKQGSRTLLSSVEAFDEVNAKKWCDFLTVYLYQSLTEYPQRLDDWASIDSEPETGPKLKNEFYTRCLSIVAPAWAGIFMESAQRSLFKNLVAQHVPAHLSVHFHWLNPTEMRAFESAYLQWLYEKSRPDTNVAKLDQCAARLAQILTARKKEQS